MQGHSKTSISVMWCGSASGECPPPMVVYKGKNLYQSWLKSGLKGCVYNVTKSGKYVLLGDNLASHFNLEVIKIAEQNDIYFCYASTKRYVFIAAVRCLCFFVD